MRILSASAALAAALGLSAMAAPAAAATGQCFDAYGRPVGAPFNTLYPNRGFIDAVIARGGTCTVSGDPGAYAPRPYSRYAYPGYYYRDPGNDPGGRHADWCNTSPPSGYCIVNER
jgi:hypothetical protein